MGLLSKFGKDKQEGQGDDGYYRAQADKASTERAKSKRASHADGAAARGRGRKDAADPVLPEKKRARRRLVGAIALALAVAIGLPMLLDSEPKSPVSDIAIQIPSKDKAGEPVSAGEAHAPAAVAVPAGEQPAPAAQPAVAPASKPAVVPSAALDKGEEIVPMPAKPAVPDTVKPPKAAETKIAKVEPHKPEAKESKPEPKRPEPKAEPKPEPKPETAKHAPSTDDARAMAILEGKPAEPAAASKYVIQVGAFATQDKVDEVQGKLKGAGIKSFVQKVSTASGERTRVRVGPFSSKEEADKARAKLQALGLAGSLVPA